MNNIHYSVQKLNKKKQIKTLSTYKLLATGVLLFYALEGSSIPLDILFSLTSPFKRGGGGCYIYVISCYTCSIRMRVYFIYTV